MAEFYLDFEKPIAELRNKLRELSEISTAHPGDAMANCVKMLEQQLFGRYKKFIPYYKVLVLADLEVDETLNYPSVEELRRRAEAMPVKKK